ncbi:MAG: hypothetical protein AAB551_03225 [Patescibacteria group bacterium]
MKKFSLNTVGYALIGFLALGGSISGGVLSANLVVQSLFNSGAMQDLEDEQEAEKEFQDQKKNEIRHMNDRTNECKNMTRQIKQSQKNGSKSAIEIGKKVTEFCGAVEKAKKALQAISTQGDFEDLRNDVIQPEIGDVAADLWESLNGLNAQNDVFRGLKENKSTCKNFARSMKEASRQARQSKIDVSTLLAEGDAKVKECERNYKQIGNYATAEQWEEARDLLQDYFWNNELHESFNQIRETIQSCSEIGRIVSEVDRGKKQIERVIKEFKRNKLDTSSLETIFSDALTIVDEARTLAKAGTCDREAIEDIKSRMDEAGEDLETEIENLKEELGGGKFSDQEDRHDFDF